MSKAATSNDNRSAEAGSGSLIERAAEVYDFASALRNGPRAVQVLDEPVAEAVKESVTPPAVSPAEAGAASESTPLSKPVPASAGTTPVEAGPDTIHPIDRARLIEAGFILPDSPIGTLAEEFRLVKRQLLLRAGASDDVQNPKDRMILVCSAQPNEGKTFCSLNLALSLASERDNEVLLVDADVAKPEVLSILGLSGTAGLIDAIADPQADVEDFILRTDVPKLSVLPAGKAVNNDTELLSSARAAKIIAGLATANERRIVIIDSAPALAASPAGVLAHRVGRVLMVVRADRTSEAELREAIALLDGCPDISLLLNAVSFFGTNRTYGSYYGQDL
jgi:exopolysaccharide/PEP-CTERM locus tyrosine autokinase